MFEAEKSLEFGLIKFSFTKKYLMNPSKLYACKYDGVFYIGDFKHLYTSPSEKSAYLRKSNSISN